ASHRSRRGSVESYARRRFPPGARQAARGRLQALHVPHPRLRAVARACGDVAADRSRCRTLASGVQVSASLGDHRTCTRLLLRWCSSETHFHAIVTFSVTILASLDVSGLHDGRHLFGSRYDIWLHLSNFSEPLSFHLPSDTFLGSCLA